MILRDRDSATPNLIPFEKLHQGKYREVAHKLLTVSSTTIYRVLLFLHANSTLPPRKCLLLLNLRRPLRPAASAGHALRANNALFSAVLRLQTVGAPELLGTAAERARRSCGGMDHGFHFLTRHARFCRIGMDFASSLYAHFAAATIKASGVEASLSKSQTEICARPLDEPVIMTRPYLVIFMVSSRPPLLPR